jgi:hypothetical protein
VLPQVLPVMISQTLYSIESNSREATIPGLVGAAEARGRCWPAGIITIALKIDRWKQAKSKE